MPATAAIAILCLVGLYLALGVLVAAIALLRGLSRLDSGALHAPRLLYPTLFPGLVICWPWVARRSIHLSAKRTPDDA